MIPTLAGFNLGLSAPATPNLSYTAQSTFTITNYDATLTYAVTGATRSGNQLTSVTNNATITAAYASGAPVSGTRTMLVANNARILTSFATNVVSTGCGPRPDLCCPGGTIANTSGQVCGGAPGSFIADPNQAAAFCGGQCNDNCWQLAWGCWNWRWTNYSTGPDGTGYTLIGSVWGKAT